MYSYGAPDGGFNMPRGIYTRTARHRDILKQNGSKSDPKKISATLKLKGIKPPSRLGSKASDQTKQKMSSSQREWYAAGNTRTKGMTLNISEDGLRRKIEATQRMRRNLAKRGRLTDIERIVDTYLHEHNIEHKHEHPIGRKSVDFYLPNPNVVLEADGEYWHQDKLKDRKKDDYIRSQLSGVVIIRLPGQEIKDGRWTKRLVWGAKRGV